MKAPPFSVIEFNARFPTEDSCLEWLFKTFSTGVTCPKCKRIDRYFRQRGVPAYVCQCGRHCISPKARTIFQGSTTPLKTWFYAIYLFSVSRNGVSAKELQRQLGVGYGTAHRMQRMIRLVFLGTQGRLSGNVECDDVYLGAKSYKARLHKRNHHIYVMGMIERDGRVFARVVPNLQHKTILPVMRDNLDTKDLKLFSDEHHTYNHVGKALDIPHKRVKHSAFEYYRVDQEGDAVHTNNIESFWGTCKPSLKATYRRFSPKYLQLYISEFTFRHNNKNTGRHLFWEMLTRVNITKAQQRRMIENVKRMASE